MPPPARCWYDTAREAVLASCRLETRLPAQYLADYLRNARPLWLRHRGTSALFLSSSTGRRFSKAGIGRMVCQAAETAGIEGKVGPQSLRRGCATHMLLNGTDIRHIQELIVSHCPPSAAAPAFSELARPDADIGMLAIYPRVAIKDLVDVHALRHPRGRLRGGHRSEKDCGGSAATSQPPAPPGTP